MAVSVPGKGTHKDRKARGQASWGARVVNKVHGALSTYGSYRCQWDDLLQFLCESNQCWWHLCGHLRTFVDRQEVVRGPPASMDLTNLLRRTSM